jgi:hypothetical protein
MGGIHGPRGASSRKPIFPEIHFLAYDPRHGTSMQTSACMMEEWRWINRCAIGPGIGLRRAVDATRAIR